MKNVRTQIFCNGELTADEVFPEISTWHAIGDLLKVGEYHYKLRDFVTVHGWLQFTAEDGTVVRAREV